eukprot:Amastigsp_a845828_16.p2 type:complete len:423 gc:universal Amastigsp_a845828_16:1531-263(-)
MRASRSSSTTDPETATTLCLQTVPRASSRSRIRRSAARPSMTGICRSIVTKSKSRRSTAARASQPSLATVTSKPSAFTIRARSARVIGESSTTSAVSRRADGADVAPWGSSRSERSGLERLADAEDSSPGRTTTKTAPESPSARGRISIRPARRVAMSRQFASPSPVPRTCGSEEVVATPARGSKTRSASSGRSPGPRSLTEISSASASSGDGRAATVMTVAGAVYLMAFETRFEAILKSASASEATDTHRASTSRVISTRRSRATAENSETTRSRSGAIRTCGRGVLSCTAAVGSRAPASASQRPGMSVLRILSSDCDERTRVSRSEPRTTSGSAAASATSRSPQIPTKGVRSSCVADATNRIWTAVLASTRSSAARARALAASNSCATLAPIASAATSACKSAATSQVHSSPSVLATAGR